MTPRQALLKTVNHQIPDRVPINLGGCKASGIAVTAYDKMKQALGIPGRTKVSDPRFMIAVVEEEVLRRLHVDVVPLDLSILLNLVRPDREWLPRRLFDGTEPLFPPGTRIAEDTDGSWILLEADGSPSAFRMPKGGHYFDDTSFNHGDRIDPRKFRPVSDIPDEHLKILEGYGRSLYQNTDYAILGWGFGVCFLGLSLITDRASNVTQGLPNEWMMMLMSEKETCHEIMDRSVEATIRCLGMVNQAVGNCCFAWGIAADDSGTQRGEFIRRNSGPRCSSRITRSSATGFTLTRRGKSSCTVADRFTTCCRISSRRASTSSTRCRPRRPTWIRYGSKPNSATAWYSGAAGATRSTCWGRDTRRDSTARAASGSTFSPPAAATSSTKSTTYRRTCRPRTSWRCSMRRMCTGYA